MTAEMTEVIVGAAIVAIMAFAVGLFIGTDSWRRSTSAISAVAMRLAPVLEAPGVGAMLAGSVVTVTLLIGLISLDQAALENFFELPAAWVLKAELWFGSMLLAGGFARWWVHSRRRLRDQR